MPLTRIQSDALKDAITSSNIADGTVATADLASGAVTAPKMAAGAVENYMASAGTTYMFRNKLINGDFRVWQRGTTTIPGSGTSADMFKFEPRNNTTIYSDRSTDVPSGQNFTYSMRTYATQATDDGFHIRTGVELPAAGSYGEFQPGTTWTLSFWMKSAYTGRTINPAIQLANTMVGGSHQSQFVYSTQGVQTLTTSWQKYVFSFTMPAWSASSGSLSNVICVSVRLLQGIDDTPQDTYLTGIQFERGDVATPFEHRPYALELSLCQRYYYNTYQNGISTGVENPPVIGSVYYYQSGAVAGSWKHPVRMRATPSVTFYESHVNISPGNTTFSSPTVTADFMSYVTAANTTTNGYPARTHAAFNSEL